jgi:hypothetical protein
MNVSTKSFTYRIWYRRFTIVLSLLGGALLFLATVGLGAGLGEDSAKYLSVAQNIADGNGFFDYSGSEFTLWPPLYPVMIATLHIASGIDVHLIGWLLNVLIFGAIILISGLLFERAFPHNLILAAGATLLVASSAAIFTISANISTDPLFILLILGFLLTAGEWLRAQSSQYWVALILITIAASLVRYAGISLVLAGSILTFWNYRADMRRAFQRAAFFLGASFLPLLLWARLHNLPADGSLFGERTAAVPLDNLGIIWQKISGWFAPSDFFVTQTAQLILAIAFLGLVLAVLRKDLPNIRDRFLSPFVLPSLAFFVIYMGMLIFQTSRHFRFIGLDRVHVAILPTLVLLVLTLLDQITPKKLRKLPALIGQGALAILLLAILIFPITNLAAHAFSIAKNGDIYYNILNTRELHDSELLEYVQHLEIEEDEIIYSNSEAAAWFFLRRSVALLPHVTGDEEPDWPPEGERGYLIWFHGPLDYRESIVRPDTALERGWLTLMFESDQGDVYALTR